VVFHDYREAAKTLNQLRNRPVVLSAGSKPVNLAVNKVARSTVEKASRWLVRPAHLQGKGSQLDLRGQYLFADSLISVEILGQQVDPGNLKASVFRTLYYARLTLKKLLQSFGDVVYLQEVVPGQVSVPHDRASAAEQR
jgi:hypothetical protein